MSAIVDFWKTIVLPHVPYFIRHDFWRKLFALVFAGMLTVVAYQNADAKIEMEETDFRNVPVRFTTAEKGVTLTPAGKVFMEEGAPIFKDYEQLFQKCRRRPYNLQGERR